MYELGAPRRSTARKVLPLDKGDVETARGPVHGDTTAGRATSNDEQVELLPRFETFELLSTRGRELGRCGQTRSVGSREAFHAEQRELVLIEVLSTAKDERGEVTNVRRFGNEDGEENNGI